MSPKKDRNQENIAIQKCIDEDEINLFDMLFIILKHKKMIFKVVSVVFFLSIIVSLFLPKSYIATSSVLPPNEKTTPISGMLSQASGTLGSLASGLLNQQSTTDIYVGILKSRTVADSLIKEYNLKDLYEKTYLVDVYKELSNNSIFDIDSDSSIISVSVEDHDPQRAADMANSYVTQLDIINRTVNITEGQRKRIFLEKRLQSVKEDLIKAETDLKTFQEKYKLVSIDEQTKAAIEGATDIKAMIIDAKTQLEVLKSFGTEKQNEALRLQARISELKKQLAKIESEGSDQDNDGFFIPFKDLPELGLQLARLMREFKIQQNVFELLTSQFEMAKIEEAKDVNTIQVLDNAVPPDKKAKPKRKLIVVLSTFTAFFFSVILVFFIEFLKKIKKEDEERYNNILENIKEIDFNRYKNKLNLWVNSWKKK